MVIAFLTGVLPYCENVRVVYVNPTAGTDVWSILAGVGIGVIICTISSWLEKKGWVYEFDLKSFLGDVTKKE